MTLLEVVKIPIKSETIATFKVTVGRSSAEKAMAVDLWPRDVTRFLRLFEQKLVVNFCRNVFP